MVKVIFLDAVGTLFGVKGSVGRMYAQVAASFGVAVEPEPLDRAFGQAFRGAAPMAFPGCAPAELPSQEFAWWLQLAEETFTRSGDREKFTDFREFFAALYAFFATAEPWFLYPDVIPALTTWRSRGISLGIISNFDSRLFPVLESLGLRSYFDTITFSTQVGTAKPDPQIFYEALSLHNLAPGEALHIGDSYREDYEGAIGVGIRAYWLQRGEDELGQSSAGNVCNSLTAILKNL